MPRFAFVVEGPPVSVNAKDKQTRKYQNWIRTVRAAAQAMWPYAFILDEGIDLEVRIVNYHSLLVPPLDVDNVIKHILDGLCMAVYEDDSQVQRVVSERFPAASQHGAEEELSDARIRYAEFLFVEVTWQ